MVFNRCDRVSTMTKMSGRIGCRRSSSHKLIDRENAINGGGGGACAGSHSKNGISLPSTGSSMHDGLQPASPTKPNQTTTGQSKRRQTTPRQVLHHYVRKLNAALANNPAISSRSIDHNIQSLGICSLQWTMFIMGCCCCKATHWRQYPMPPQKA